MNESWYYEYTIKVYNEVDNQMETRSGIIPADCLANIIFELENFYGDIVEIQMLKRFSEGTVLDFKEAKDNENFDYVINRKENK